MAESFDPQARAEFDRYAGQYDSMHTASIRASGEAPEYFAVYKQKCLERILGADFAAPILDFGCGIGNLTCLLAGSFSHVHGYDPSSDSAKLAESRAPSAKFFSDTKDLPTGHYGAIVLANVLHHVPPAERESLLQTISPLLAPEGRLVVFEHNPYNPVTRRAVAACPFDENVVLLPPGEVTRLLASIELQEIRRDFIVFFPRALAALRGLEPHLRWLPAGAQVCAWGVRR